MIDGTIFATSNTDG